MAGSGGISAASFPKPPGLFALLRTCGRASGRRWPDSTAPLRSMVGAMTSDGFGDVKQTLYYRDDSGSLAAVVTIAAVG